MGGLREMSDDEGDVFVCMVAAHNGKEEECRELGFLGINYQLALHPIFIYFSF